MENQSNLRKQFNKKAQFLIKIPFKMIFQMKIILNF